MDKLALAKKKRILIQTALVEAHSQLNIILKRGILLQNMFLIM